MTLSLRRIAERVTRNVVFKARLPKRFGRRPIYLSPDNNLAVMKLGDAKFEAYLLGFVDRFVETNSIVWDIGANMGVFAIPAAHKARFTLAFEPDPFNVNLLNRTQRLNRELALDVLPVALSNELGIAKLAIAVRGRSANSLVGLQHSTQTGGVREEYSVVTVTPDWAMERCSPPPTFIKCDAEGAETMILEGATRILAEARPVMVIEMANENADACAAIFRANNYVTMSAYHAIDPAKIVDDLRDVWDVLAIPREKLSGMVGK